MIVVNPGVFQSFYTTVAQTCFTILGLWWVLLGFRYQDWMRDPRHRWIVYDISLYFLLPGMASSLAFLAVDVPKLWKVSFALFGAVGALESIVSLALPNAPWRRSLIVRLCDALSIVLYAAVGLLAAWRAGQLGIELRPLQAEGILLAALIALGVVLAGHMFVSSDPSA